MRLWIAEKLSLVVRWLMRKESRADVNIEVGNPGQTKELVSQVSLNVSVRPAMNGKVLELNKWVPANHGQSTRHAGGDWKQTLYVIKEGERLDEAVTALLVTQALDR